MEGQVFEREALMILDPAFSTARFRLWWLWRWWTDWAARHYQRLTRAHKADSQALHQEVRPSSQPARHRAVSEAYCRLLMASMMLNDLEARKPPAGAPPLECWFYEMTARRVRSIDRNARDRLMVALKSLAASPDQDVACVIDGSVVAVCRHPDGLVVVENATVID
jgi:hypothetical protein